MGKLPKTNMDRAMTQQKRPLTLRDVSEAAGVSEMTVSRVLRNRGDVSAITRARGIRTQQKSLATCPIRLQEL